MEMTQKQLKATGIGSYLKKRLQGPALLVCRWGASSAGKMQWQTLIRSRRCETTKWQAFLQRTQPAMAGTKEQQDCLFCNLCGSLLAFDSASFASCLLCQNQRSVKDFQGTEIWYKSTPQDFMRRLGVDLLIQPEEDDSEAKETDQIQQRAVVNDECPKCKNPSLEYYTKQLRSADEGQTVFYECPKCHHKFSQNM